MQNAERALCELAQRASDNLEFRRGALALLGESIRFDAALFHELSPRVPLERAALVGLTPELIESSRARWDENAVLFGRLRDLALEQAGVASDHDAFPVGSRARKNWDERVARPFRARATLAGHLIVREKIIGAVLLFRRTAAGFSARDQAALRALLPALAVGDALHQALAANALAGPAVGLRCQDQRLTPRQREIVERVALGHTNAQIGEALGLSANTVRNLLTDVRARLAAANRAEIVRLAVLR
jgi:DNA-binding CsgD family transcriptional regulator